MLQKILFRISLFYNGKKENLFHFKISFRAYTIKAVKNLILLSFRKVEKENSLLKNMLIQEDDVQEFIDKPNFRNITLEALNKLPLKRKRDFYICLYEWPQL